MALGTGEGEAQERRRRRLDPVEDVGEPNLFGDRTALRIHEMIAVERCRQHLLLRRLVEEIAGEHFDNDFVEGATRVDLPNEPVSPGPGPAVIVKLVAV